MKEILKHIFLLLATFGYILLFFISFICVWDTFTIWCDLIKDGKNVEYQRFILDILGCILMCYNAHDIANDE